MRANRANPNRTDRSIFGDRPAAPKPLERPPVSEPGQSHRPGPRSFSILDKLSEDKQTAQRAARRGLGGFQPPPRQRGEGQLWRITGGSGSNGIVVRLGKSLSSTEIRSRISSGSVVEEVELDGNRLHYRLIEGHGPQQGWVTVTNQGKALAERIEQEPGIEDMLNMDTALPIFLPGDSVHVYSISKKQWAEDGVVQEIAEQEVDVDGQRMPAGSMLVAYDDGRGMKWVSPQEMETVLRKVPVFAPGDKVHVWSFSSNSWAEDGVVQDVAPERMEIEGEEVPKGSAFVVYNGGQGMKCITLAEQPQTLRLAMPAPAWFNMGDQVEVWSVNSNAWAQDGVVQQISAENLLIQGQEVARGAVFVIYNEGQGMKWVMPWEQEQILRGGSLPQRREGEEEQEDPQQLPPLEEEGAVDDRAAEYEGLDGLDDPGDHAEGLAAGGGGGGAQEEEEQGKKEEEEEAEEEEEELGEMMVASETWEPSAVSPKPGLALFFGTVITVTQRDSRGEWFYGRTIDGAKGWFPADKVKPEGEFRFNDSSSDEGDPAAE